MEGSSDSPTGISGSEIAPPNPETPITSVTTFKPTAIGYDLETKPFAPRADQRLAKEAQESARRAQALNTPDTGTRYFVTGGSTGVEVLTDAQIQARQAKPGSLRRFWNSLTSKKP